MKKKILVAFNNLQDNTMTDVVFCLLNWQKYYANHPTIEIEIYRCHKWGFEFNFNEFMRYGIENGFDYVFQYDCDMTGHVKVLEQLISHDKEAVGCLYYSRQGLKPQVWDAEGTDTDISMFYEPHFEVIEQAIKDKSLIASDVRASGFTLFKVEALKQFEYPYGIMRPNTQQKYAINGFDMDITWKFSRKFGKVWTDPDPSLQVAHIRNHHITVEEGLHISKIRSQQSWHKKNSKETQPSQSS